MVLKWFGRNKDKKSKEVIKLEEQLEGVQIERTALEYELNESRSEATKLQGHLDDSIQQNAQLSNVNRTLQTRVQAQYAQLGEQRTLIERQAQAVNLIPKIKQAAIQNALDLGAVQISPLIAQLDSPQIYKFALQGDTLFYAPLKQGDHRDEQFSQLSDKYIIANQQMKLLNPSSTHATRLGFTDTNGQKYIAHFVGIQDGVKGDASYSYGLLYLQQRHKDTLGKLHLKFDKRHARDSRRKLQSLAEIATQPSYDKNPNSLYYVFDRASSTGITIHHTNDKKSKPLNSESMEQILALTYSGIKVDLYGATPQQELPKLGGAYAILFNPDTKPAFFEYHGPKPKKQTKEATEGLPRPT